MSKVYTSAVVIIPPKEKWTPIQEIRKKYDRHFNDWMPHITLLYPFRPKTQYEDMVKKFSELSKRFDSIQISLKKFKYFEHKYENIILWLDPEPNDYIINLQLEFLKIAPDCNDVNKFKEGFRPHLSVGQITGRTQLKKSIKGLQNTWNELNFEVNEFYFISREQHKDSKFRIDKQIPLKI